MPTKRPPEGKRQTETAASSTGAGLRLVVGVGASAGGLEALTQLLRNLPADTGMAFVLVQHLDPDHSSALTQILSKATSLPVLEAANDLAVKPDHVYVIPPNANLSMARGVLKLQPRETGRGVTRSIDLFFKSLAQDQHERAIGVILSGTASDGTLGLEAIKAEGGITFAQDATARYDSMPRSAIAAGCIDFVLSPDKIAKELARIGEHPYVAGQAPDLPAASEEDSAFIASREAASSDDGPPARRDDDSVKKVLLLLRNHSGVDFSLYKPSTVRRRIARRTVLNKLDGVDNYTQFLRGNDAEMGALYSDLLISVTGFFRNPEAFEILKRDVFPKFVAERRDDPVRIWVLGCSSGQEAYSLAMTYAEFSDHIPRAPKLQMFATDLNEAMLERARAGLYTGSMVADLSAERLRRFFVEESGGYRVCKPLREAIVFARQNLLRDPPFSRMDLISCRNLLIYVEPSLQKTVLPMFHYALQPKGCLFLGASESVGSYTELFEPMDKKHRIYLKKPGRVPTGAMRLGPPVPARKQDIRAAKARDAADGFRAELDVQREADRVTLNRFSPTGVLVNAAFQVLQFRGDTSPYLKPPTGQATFSVLKMARDGLMLPLRTALAEAKKQNKAVRKERLRIGQNGQTRTASLEVVPLRNLKERCYLIFFEDGEKAARTAGARPPPAAKPRGGSTKTRLAAKEDARRIAELESEVAEMRDYLQSIQEQYEAANEELQASNEEVTSSNEELQSLNEEMETSKEELESANEELTTVNDEMANRNAELGRLNSDLTNLQNSTRLAVVLLERNLAIRRFSTRAEKQFGLLATDLGRPFGSIRHNLDLADLDGLIVDVIDTVHEQDREVRDRDGRWYSLRIRPYLTVDNKVDGAVLVLVDIDKLKRAELATAAAREQADAIIRTTPEPLLVLDADLRVRSANNGFYRAFSLSAEETEGRSIFELDGASWDIPRLRQLLEDIIPRNSFFDDFEVTHSFKRLGRRTMLLNARTLNDQSGEPAQILLGIRDLTNVLAFQAEMRRSELRYRRLFEAARDGILILDPDTRKIVDANPFMTELLGYTHEELCGKELFEIGLLEDRAASEAAFRRLQTDGHVRYSHLPLVTKDGAHCEVEFISALYHEDGERVIQCNIRGMAELKEAEKHRGMLMAELDHRVRNTLAAVQAIARQTGRHSASFEEFRKSFDSRLLALSKTHRLLTAGQWKSASLRALVLAELSPYGRDGQHPFTIAGEEMQLSPKQALALGLGIHELATNAAKYGALSVPAGNVDVSWNVTHGGASENALVLELQWIETGGPRVAKPDRAGFGSTLVERGLKGELDADVQLEFRPEGVRCVLRFPLAPEAT